MSCHVRRGRSDCQDMWAAEYRVERLGLEGPMICSKFCTGYIKWCEPRLWPVTTAPASHLSPLSAATRALFETTQVLLQHLLPPLHAIKSAVTHHGFLKHKVNIRGRRCLIEARDARESGPPIRCLKCFFLSPAKLTIPLGVDFWHTASVPRLGIKAIRTSDGPNGIRGTRFFNGVPAACFPCVSVPKPPL